MRPELKVAISQNVSVALAEDIGSGDKTAELIDSRQQSDAFVISRSPGVFCGRPWVDEIAARFDGDFEIEWYVKDGDPVDKNDELARFSGSSCAILSAERTILNFLQLLSATATMTREYCERIKHTPAVILDTRKTLPGLRLAQKYAVVLGGGQNHRLGLYDAFLIKENHISAAGSIEDAVRNARERHPRLPIEVEVETLDQLQECLRLNVPRVLLDNFDLVTIRKAVALAQHRLKLEVSGGITLENVAAIAGTGVDYISVGALTKNVNALDLTMRFDYSKVQ